MSKKNRRKRKPKPQLQQPPKNAGAPSSNPPKVKLDWLSRGLAIASLLVSLVAVGVTFTTNRWRSAYFYAAPNDLTYRYTQSNRLDTNDLPESSNTTIIVYNSGSTPARDVRVLVQPLTVKPDIRCDQPSSIQNAPWGAIAITIGRIPANGSAKLTIFEKTSKFPPSFEPWTGLKYQYAAKVNGVETEFGPVRCEYDRCAIFFVPRPDDTNEPYVKHPSGLTIDEIESEPFPDAKLIEVPSKDIEIFEHQATPVSTPPR